MGKKELNLINVNELKFIVKIKEESKLKATAIMEYYNMRVKGFRIMNSEHIDEIIGGKIWIQVPAFLAGKYHDMFFLEPKEEWNKFKKKLYEAYLEADKKYYNKRLNIKEKDEGIDIDSIKFD